MSPTTPAPVEAEALLVAALARVESTSIRTWASSAQNRPVFARLAQVAIDKRGPSANEHMFAAYIVATAIGL
jgi:hypothetical protein